MRGWVSLMTLYTLLPPQIKRQQAAALPLKVLTGRQTRRHVNKNIFIINLAGQASQATQVADPFQGSFMRVDRCFSACLLQQNHLPHRAEITCNEAIDIHTRRQTRAIEGDVVRSRIAPAVAQF